MNLMDFLANYHFITSLFILIFGAALGSFFNVCIFRIPKGISIANPPSFCPKCKNPIKPWHNIPFISWIIQGGKCRYCGKPIAFKYLLLEIITPVVLLAIFFRFNTIEQANQFGLSLVFFKYALFFCFGIIMFFIDLKHQILPHTLTQPLIEIGIIFSLFKQSDISLKTSLIGASIGFGIFLAIFLYYAYARKLDNEEPETTDAIEEDDYEGSSDWGFITYHIYAFIKYKVLKIKKPTDEEIEELESTGIGGGDLFLLAATGAFTGFAGVIFTILIGSILGLFYALIIKKRQIPFGPFLLSGTFLYVLIGHKILYWYLSFMNV